MLLEEQKSREYVEYIVAPKISEYGACMMPLWRRLPYT
jgi:hypothetical protein